MKRPRPAFLVVVHSAWIAIASALLLASCTVVPEPSSYAYQPAPCPPGVAAQPAPQAQVQPGQDPSMAPAPTGVPAPQPTAAPQCYSAVPNGYTYQAYPGVYAYPAYGYPYGAYPYGYPYYGGPYVGGVWVGGGWHRRW